MPERATDPRVNPSYETIGTKGLVVRFLLTGDNSNGSIAAFELNVLAGERLPAPAHSHDHYEETIYGIDGVLTWTVDGKHIDVGPGQALCIPRGAVHRFDNNGSRMRRCSAWSRRPQSVRNIFARPSLYSTPLPAAHLIEPSWQKSCAVTALRALRPRHRARARTARGNNDFVASCSCAAESLPAGKAYVRKLLHRAPRRRHHHPCGRPGLSLGS